MRIPHKTSNRCFPLQLKKDNIMFPIRRFSPSPEIIGSARLNIKRVRCPTVMIVARITLNIFASGSIIICRYNHSSLRISPFRLDPDMTIRRLRSCNFSISLSNNKRNRDVRFGNVIFGHDNHFYRIRKPLIYSAFQYLRSHCADLGRTAFSAVGDKSIYVIVSFTRNSRQNNTGIISVCVTVQFTLIIKRIKRCQLPVHIDIKFVTGRIGCIDHHRKSIVGRRIISDTCIIV